MRKILDRAALATGRDQRLGLLAGRLASVHGGAPMVSEPSGWTLTFEQAAERVDRWAGAVAARAGAGDRVVLAVPNGYDLLLLCLAVSRAGGVPVPVNARMRGEEIEHVIGDSGAVLVVRDAAELEGADPLGAAATGDADDVAAIFYTSGTTGKPKGARLTHRGLLGSVGAASLYPRRLRRDEAVIALPVAHIMGFAVLLGLAAAGIPVHLLPRFEAGPVLDAIERRRATVFVGVPAMYRMLLEAGAETRDLRSVRLWGAGADVMPRDLARRFQRMGATVTLPLLGVSVGEALFVEGYGLVESGGGALVRVSPPGLDLPFAEALGVPLPGYRVRIVGDDGRNVPPGAVGELWLRGPGVLEGYHDDPAATAEAVTDEGWLRTGDLGRRGPLGSVAFAGRKKDVVKVGGYSVFAAEVEAVVEEHADVLECAVVGLPDERLGEVPGAAVRVRPGSSVTPEALVAWAADHLAPYKTPRRVVILDDLPRTGTQKVQKRQLLPHFD
ncbi:MAG TPA: AMP-binding protein [Acidimicrobiales bacterium]|nr:AMP-binding protein [Acidimicrobiales bacterium]